MTTTLPKQITNRYMTDIVFNLETSVQQVNGKIRYVMCYVNHDVQLALFLVDSYGEDNNKDKMLQQLNLDVNWIKVS
jgi:hypothetical protein